MPLGPSPGRGGRTAEGDHGSRARCILGSRPEAQAQRTSFNSKKKKERGGIMEEGRKIRAKRTGAFIVNGQLLPGVSGAPPSVGSQGRRELGIRRLRLSGWLCLNFLSDLVDVISPFCLLPIVIL